jgi:PRTRC genetic system protein A
MNLVKAILAESPQLPPIEALGYEFVVASNGLFVRAEDGRIEALIPVAPATLHGLANVEPYARLKMPRVPRSFLRSVLASARRFLPREAMYQFAYFPGTPDDLQTRNGWRAGMPDQIMSVASLKFEDFSASVIDLHSHGALRAFFSDTDDGDEQGLRFYVVIGRVDTDWPEISARVGVYGHHWPVPIETVFEGAGLFMDTFALSSENPKIDQENEL